jgi:hypothetical protein
MEYSGALSGGTAPLVATYKAGETLTAGRVVNSETTAGTGQLEAATATGFVDCMGTVMAVGGGVGVGRNIGSLTYSTTQGDAEGLADVNCDPHAIYRGLLSGGATANTALQDLISTSADTNGLTITDADVGTATMVNGIAWLKGNKDESRVIVTFNSATSIVVTVPFSQDIGTTETYHFTPMCPGRTVAVQLTSTLDQINSAIAVGTGGTARCQSVELDGATNSFANIVFSNHYFSPID